MRSWEARGAELITLGPLQRAVASLTGQAVGAKPTARLLRMVAAAAGNPLYVIELARALATDGPQETRTGAAGPAPASRSAPGAQGPCPSR